MSDFTFYEPAELFRPGKVYAAEFVHYQDIRNATSRYIRFHFKVTSEKGTVEQICLHAPAMNTNKHKLVGILAVLRGGDPIRAEQGLEELKGVRVGITVRLKRHDEGEIAVVDTVVPLPRASPRRDDIDDLLFGS